MSEENNSTVTIKLDGEAQAEAKVLNAEGGPKTKEDLFTNPIVNGQIKTEEDAKDFLTGMFNFFRSGAAETTAKSVSEKTGLPPRVIAHNFAMKCLGMLSDLFHLSLDCVEDAITTLLNLLTKVLLSGMGLIMRVAKRLVRIVTLNQTARQTA